MAIMHVVRQQVDLWPYRTEETLIWLSCFDMQDRVCRYEFQTQSTVKYIVQSAVSLVLQLYTYLLMYCLDTIKNASGKPNQQQLRFRHPFLHLADQCYAYETLHGWITSSVHNVT